MVNVRNSFGWKVGNIVDRQYRQRVTSRNYFRGVVDGWLLDEAVIAKLLKHKVREIRLYDQDNKINYYVSLDNFLDRCEVVKSRYGAIYILPEGRFDSIEPKQHNWPIPYC